MKKTLSLESKLLLVVAFVIVITLWVFYTLAITNQKKIFSASFHDSAVFLALALDASIGSIVELKDATKLQSTIYKMIWLSSNITAIKVSVPIDNTLRVIATNEAGALGTEPPEEGVVSYQSGTVFNQEIREPNGAPVLRVITPVHVGGQRVGIYAIKISLETLEKAIAETQQQFLLITLASILLVLGILSFSIRHIVINSIKELLGAMEKIGSGPLAHRVSTKRHDEIGELFTGFNGMAQKLDERTTELSREKSHIETIIDNLADGLIEYSRAGRILRMNRAAERILGISENDVIGTLATPRRRKDGTRHPLAYILFGDIQSDIKTPKQMLSEIRAFDITYPITRSIQAATVTLPRSAASEGSFVCILHDVTREKLIDQNKSSFITIAAHQMRTPLSATKWALSLLLEDYAPQIGRNKKVKELIGTAFETNENMINLANDLLLASRIEDGRYGCVFAKADICKVISEISQEYSPIMAEKSLSFTSTCPQGLKPFLFDASRISIAIHSLIDNAINYTKGGGSVALGVAQETDHLLITVTDTGIGIPKTSMDKIFAKFYRAENAIRTFPNGSGMGLYITKSIVTQHQGTVSAAPNKPAGTSFVIRIPLHPEIAR